MGTNVDVRGARRQENPSSHKRQQCGQHNTWLLQVHIRGQFVAVKAQSHLHNGSNFTVTSTQHVQAAPSSQSRHDGAVPRGMVDWPEQSRWHSNSHRPLVMPAVQCA